MFEDIFLLPNVSKCGDIHLLILYKSFISIIISPQTTFGILGISCIINSLNILFIWRHVGLFFLIFPKSDNLRIATNCSNFIKMFVITESGILLYFKPPCMILTIDEKLLIKFDADFDSIQLSQIFSLMISSLNNDVLLICSGIRILLRIIKPCLFVGNDIP